ncbi:MAG: hypothetical protein P8X95_13675 [Anaerolineales bacterium]
MSDLPLFISEYGLYLFIGIVWLAAVGVFAIRNAKVCTLPAECFDCKENFNPIDIVMATGECTFLEAVEYLKERMR